MSDFPFQRVLALLHYHASSLDICMDDNNLSGEIIFLGYSVDCVSFISMHSILLTEAQAEYFWKLGHCSCVCGRNEETQIILTEQLSALNPTVMMAILIPKFDNL